MVTKLQEEQWDEALTTYVGDHLNLEALKAAISEAEEAENMMGFVENNKASEFTTDQLQLFYKVVMEFSHLNPIHKEI